MKRKSERKSERKAETTHAEKQEVTTLKFKNKRQ